MRFLRYSVIIIFCLSLIIFVSSIVKEYVNNDSSKPSLESDREVLEISCNYTPDQLLTGLKAYDEEDGDLTNQIIVGNLTRFIDKGTCNVTYAVFDSDNQSASLTRKVRFTDYHSPRFYASKPLVFNEKSGNMTKLKEYLSVNDVLDGDLTDAIVYGTSNVNFSLTGDYTYNFEVTNSFGDATTVQLPIHIIEEKNTIDIQLTSGIEYISLNQSFDPSQWLQSVKTSNGKSVSLKNVKITSNVDINTPGMYEIHYSITSGSETGETWLTVFVE